LTLGRDATTIFNLSGYATRRPKESRYFAAEPKETLLERNASEAENARMRQNWLLSAKNEFKHSDVIDVFIRQPSGREDAALLRGICGRTA
jgi:hypothetical protein